MDKAYLYPMKIFLIIYKEIFRRKLFKNERKNKRIYEEKL